MARSFSSSNIKLKKENPRDSFDIPVATDTEFTSAALKYFNGDRSHKTLACLLRRPALSFSWTRWETLSQMIADKHFDPCLPLSMAPIENFHLQRSRIPTSSFKSIAHEIDLVKVQYQRDSHHPLHMGYKSYACLAPVSEMFRAILSNTKVFFCRFSITCWQNFNRFIRLLHKHM